MVMGLKLLSFGNARSTACRSRGGVPPPGARPVGCGSAGSLVPIPGQYSTGLVPPSATVRFGPPGPCPVSGAGRLAGLSRQSYPLSSSDALICLDVACAGLLDHVAGQCWGRLRVAFVPAGLGRV